MNEVTWNVGEQVEWLTRPVPNGYLRGIIVKPGKSKIGIAVQSPKTGEWKPKWAEPRYLRVLQPCGNCGKLTSESDLSAVGVIFVKDGESGTIEYCLACTDYLLDTPEGEMVVLEVSGEPVTLAWQFYHQNV